MGERGWAAGLLGFLSIWVTSSCAKQPTKVPLGPAPEAVSVQASSVTLGVQRGTLRSSADVAAFRIARTPTRAADYAACVAAGACKVATTQSCSTNVDAADSEVVATCVATDQARAYCSWVGGRLPTLAEWLLAVRGPDVQRFSWGNAPPNCKQHWSGVCEKRLKNCAEADNPKGCIPDASFVAGKHPKGASSFGVEDALLPAGGELVSGDPSSALLGCPDDKVSCLITSEVGSPASIDYVSAPPADFGEAGAAVGDFGFRCAWSEK
jgi:formylglycine-generating enzyme required for sulfatase activity